MNKLTTVLIGTTMILGCVDATASAPPDIKSVKSHELTETQLRTIQAVHPWIGESKTDPFRKPQVTAQAPAVRQPKHVRAVNPSGSTIQGYRTSKSYTTPVSGWYDLATDGEETFMWEYKDPTWVDDGTSDPPAFPFSVGFYRNDTMYAFHAQTLFNWIVWGYGSFSMSDGTITSWQSYGEEMDDTDFSTYVISCAYDQSRDLVYAYTLNSEGSGYMLQTVNPETWKFNVIKSQVNIEDICIGFTYNCDDKKLYGVTPDARFVTMNGENGSLSLLANLGLSVTTSVEGLTYSPLDKKFFFVYTVGAYGQDSSTLYWIDASDYSITEIKTLENAIQYRILICPDKGKSNNTPQAPEIVDIAFPKGASNGTVKLRMPQTSLDGSLLSGTLSVKVFVDSEEKATADAKADELVEIAVNGIEEGNHRFSFIVTCNGSESAEVDRTVYVGFDTPVAPDGVLLSEGKLTWTPSLSGINNGYIDSDNLTYNIYLNGTKINVDPFRGNEFNFTMPDASYSVYTAEVEATAHGKTSDKGVSNQIKYGNPYPMPYSIVPTAEELPLVEILPSPQSNVYTSWRPDNNYGQDKDYSLAVYTSGYNSENEWFFLPPVRTLGEGNLVEITLEAATGYDGSNENLEVAFGTAPTPEAMTTVGKWESLSEGNWVTLKARFFAESECGYIGAKTIKHAEGYRLKVRNIKSERSAISSDIPAAASGLAASPKPKGELRTTVSFVMPSLTMAGKALDGDVTAHVSTSAETVSVSGKPGSEQKVEIAAVKGFDTVTVTTGDKTDGMKATLKIFTGNDVPLTLKDITVAHSEDFQGFTLTWEAPTKGQNGGYVNPDEVTYALCRYNPDEWAWEIAEELGNSTSYEYAPGYSEDLSMVELGILTQNSEGNAGELRTVTVNLGKPLALPLDAIPDSEYSSSVLHANMMAEAPTEAYTESWGYVPEISPSFVPVAPIDGTGGYVVDGPAGTRARAVLAPFSTSGLESAGMELQMWTSTDKDSIAVYAEAYGVPCRLIGRYSAENADTWAKYRFHLPAEFIGKQWVSVKIDAEINSDNGSVAFGRYTVKTFVPDDLAILSIDAPNFPVLDDRAVVTVKVANIGTESAPAPSPSLTVTKDNRTLAVIPMKCTEQAAEIKELDELTYEASWIPVPADLGDIMFAVEFDNKDADTDNNSISVNATVYKGNLPLVSDLAASADEEGVHLSWSDPVLADGYEGFENYPSFYYGNTIGRFKTFSLDGEDTMCFGNLRFPYDKEPKGWQVFDETDMTIRFLNAGITDSYMTAPEGKHFIATFVPYTEFMLADLTSDRWIVSPQVKPGSEFSFMLTSGVTLKEENLQVLYSTTDDAPESFSVLDDITLLTAEWRKYSYTLPDNARYFALRYCGNTERGFFALADDFRYEADEEYGVLEGYDIYRDGIRIQDNMNVRGEWTDDSPVTGNVSYSIVPVYRKAGGLVRGLMSNEVSLYRSGIDGIYSSDWKVSGAPGAIILDGLADSEVSVFGIDGILACSVNVDTDHVRLDMQPGAYIIVTSKGKTKVIVK